MRLPVLGRITNWSLFGPCPDRHYNQCPQSEYTCSSRPDFAELFTALHLERDIEAIDLWSDSVVCIVINLLSHGHSRVVNRRSHGLHGFHLSTSFCLDFHCSLARGFVLRFSSPMIHSLLWLSITLRRYGALEIVGVIIRPPGTLVPKAFCFSRDVF